MTNRGGYLKRRNISLSTSSKNNFSLLVLCIPAVSLFLVFNYLPMAGIVVAFKKFSVAKGLFNSPWCGFDNFRFLFSSVDTWRITRNTLGYNTLFIIFNTLISLCIALTLDSLRSRVSVKFFQTVNFFPHFMSWVVAGFMLYAFLQPQYGLVNNLLTSLGLEPMAWYMESKYWPFILPVMYVWKNAGYTSLIYYSGLLGIDTSYSEAAQIDGASPGQIIRFIKLPQLSPIMIMMILLAVGKIFYADFGLFYNLPRNIGILYETTDVIDTYVYRSLKISGNIGMGSAAGFYQSILGFIIVMATNFAVKKIDPEKALF
jgi:putative aldouronate transport system permease protein